MLFLLPTDTCYGLAGEFNEQDYREIYRLKGRDFVKPLAWLVRDYEDLKTYIEITDEQIEFLKKYHRPWSILGKRNENYQLPDFLDEKMYERISLRVAKVCLKSPLGSPDKGRGPTVSVEDRGVLFGGRGVSYIPYQKELTKKAQENRKNMNFPERKMWYEILINPFFREYKFNRQKPLLNYIVDFYSQKLALVIEIDGDSHIKTETIRYDSIRTQELQNYGLTVLRFSNHDIMKNTEGVFEALKEYIETKKNPPLSPLIRGARFPLFLTSANLSGNPESKTLTEARELFPGVMGFDGGICDEPPSDIFSFKEDGKIKYLRRTI